MTDGTAEVGFPRGASEGRSPALLEVRDLEVEFFSRHGRVHAVRGVSFAVDRGETLGLVGESGSGKSVTSQAVLGIVDEPGRVVGGDILWKGRSVVHGKDASGYAARVRGKELAIVFQDPMSSLNPLFRVGTQLTEVLRHHLDMSRRSARDRAADLLDLVGIAAPGRVLRRYPWELSGGMQQRVLIAMALACEPELLIADEPTTALDVTIQAQIFELLRDVQRQLDLAVLLITHDLGVVAGFCERVAVMYAGRIIEEAEAGELYEEPGSPYTAGLLRAMPRLDVRRPRLEAIKGSPPDMRNPPPGCAFHPRCPLAIEPCRAERPALDEVRPGRHVACWRGFDPALSVSSSGDLGTVDGESM